MKKKLKEAISVLYRIQGGNQPNSSKKFITAQDGKIQIKKIRKENSVYIGDSQHMIYFLRKRLGIRKNITEYISNHMDLQELSDRNVEVIRMYVPEWFKYMLLATAVGQDNQRIELPKLVDKTTPGDSFGISRLVDRLIRRCLLLWRKYICS